MAAMGNMGMGLPGEPPMAEGMAVDPGGMGVPPAVMPSDDEMMMQALMAVLQKWDGAKAQLAGEQSSLIETLMLIASAQPPGAAEAAVMGGDPMAYETGPEMMPEQGMI